MNKSISSVEELYETLIDLENERAVSKKINQESNNLLKGLKVLVERFNEKDILTDIISILRDIVGCEDIIIMAANERHELITQSATSNFFYDIQLEPQTFLNRIIKGDISISFDIQLIPEWNLLSKKLNNRIKSVIHVGLEFSERNTILICCDSRPNFFNRAHADLIKRYSMLVTQALININSQEKINRLNKNLNNMARQAGMADIATNILHNMGNILNSLNVSAKIVIKKLDNSMALNLSRLVVSLKNHPDDLVDYLTNDNKGKMIIPYLDELSRSLDEERNSMHKEMWYLIEKMEQINNIVAMQQSNAEYSGVYENINLIDLIEDALKMQFLSTQENSIQIIRDFLEPPLVYADQYKLLQIIANLLSSAKYAVINHHADPKTIKISINCIHDEVAISISDNGIGIDKENLTKIFQYGFTTKEGSYGFGLHNSANAAKEMGGSIIAESDGVGMGATFIVKLPIYSPRSRNEGNK